jgi:hypothetical protein
MRLLLDSFWRAVAYCMLPRVIVLSLLPLGLMVLLAAGLGYFYWDATVAWTRERARGLAPAVELLGLDRAALFGRRHLRAGAVGGGGRRHAVDRGGVAADRGRPHGARADQLVAHRRFPALEHKKGASFFGSMARSLGSRCWRCWRSWSRCRSG